MKSLFLEKIMDTAWLIKQSTSGDAFIYYDYLLYLSE